jgi:hypothetical protein
VEEYVQGPGSLSVQFSCTGPELEIQRRLDVTNLRGGLEALVVAVSQETWEQGPSLLRVAAEEAFFIALEVQLRERLVYAF